MKVYCQIEEGVIRYLDEWNIDPLLLLKMSILEQENGYIPFYKADNRITRSMIMNCDPIEYRTLFQEALRGNRYMGELIEDYVTYAFFEYVYR